jgi:hypothetical protein
MEPVQEFTEEEQGRYDRQIRLWGIEAQHRYAFNEFLLLASGPLLHISRFLTSSAVRVTLNIPSECEVLLSSWFLSEV